MSEKITADWLNQIYVDLTDTLANSDHNITSGITKVSVAAGDKLLASTVNTLIDNIKSLQNNSFIKSYADAFKNGEALDSVTAGAKVASTTKEQIENYMTDILDICQNIITSQGGASGDTNNSNTFSAASGNTTNVTNFSPGGGVAVNVTTFRAATGDGFNSTNFSPASGCTQRSTTFRAGSGFTNTSDNNRVNNFSAAGGNTNNSRTFRAASGNTTNGTNFQATTQTCFGFSPTFFQASGQTNNRNTFVAASGFTTVFPIWIMEK